jgi:hypothetical protein
MALIGFGQTLALEGAKHNIKVNTIAPIANSRMLSSVLPPDVCKHFRPEAVSAMVLALCHETCPESGGAFELGAGWYSKLRWQRTRGLSMDPTKVNAQPDALETLTLYVHEECFLSCGAPMLTRQMSHHTRHLDPLALSPQLPIPSLRPSAMRP